MNNIVIARFLNSRVATAHSQWQYDYGQILDVQGIDDLPSAFEAHFANAGAASTITQIGTNGQVVIPDQCFLNGKRIDVYIYLHTGADDGETEYHIIIPVNARPQPSDTPPTPVQQDAITQAIAALNDAVTQTGDDVTAAAGYADAAEASAVRAEEAAASIDEEMIANAVEDYLEEHPVTVDETDPTVPSWAKQENKPSYTASEIGALSAESLPDAIDEALAEAKESGLFDGPQGPAGETGATGAKGDKGDKGDTGATGPQGTSGYSPTVTVTDITGGHRVTITDLNGNHTFDVMDGEDGEGSSITVDSALSDSSTNPVQNKVIKVALDGKGTYSKPSGGIPKSDLAAAVQTSLGKADTALQSVPSTYRTAAAQDTIDAGKIDKEQGVANAGKFMVVDSNGLVIPSATSETAIQNAVDDWLDENRGSIDGISFAIKNALLACFENVAWINANGQTYYDALHDAIFPPVDLDSISAVFNQGSAVIYDNDSLDTLKQYLVVTATYSDSSTATVTDYMLSGTLTEGTSTITVSYGGKTDTFNVTVTHYVQSYVTDGLVAKFDAIDNTGNGHDASATTWKDLVGSYDITVPSGKATWDNNALVFDGSQGNNIFPLTAWPTSATRTVEIVMMPTNISTNVVANVGKEGAGRCLWLLDSENAVAVSNASENAYVSPLSALSDIRQLSVSYSGNYATSHVIINGQETTTRGPASHTMSNSSSNLVIGAQGHSGNYAFIGKIYAIRIYDRVLTAAEVAQNLAVDTDTYGLVM